MDPNQGKLRLFVRSRVVPVGLTEFPRATANGLGVLSEENTRAVLYERVLDDSQARLVAEARQLSRSSGIDLEVVDLGRMGLLQRLFWARLARSSPTLLPENRLVPGRAPTHVNAAQKSSIR